MSSDACSLLPFSSGNIVDLVKRGFYTNQKIVRSDGFVVQAGPSIRS